MEDKGGYSYGNIALDQPLDIVPVTRDGIRHFVIIGDGFDEVKGYRYLPTLLRRDGKLVVVFEVVIRLLLFEGDLMKVVGTPLLGRKFKKHHFGAVKLRDIDIEEYRLILVGGRVAETILLCNLILRREKSQQ